ncbi:MAG TPA: hypothetical protein VFW45_04880 [Candidatus Polarisedimenticolia bacterium]|nr:hypothetical protein [Candidatus Polarisedimenticolia bacterium]
MDPLNLLRELYGEDPVRKILNSGFDSPAKIAAATAESLSFFAGVQEALARQIIESAEAALAGHGASSERRDAPAASGRAIQPRELPRAAAGATAAAGPTKKESSKGRAPKGELQEERSSLKSELLDERPLLDAGGLLKNLAKEPNPKELLSDSDFLEEVGLTDAEAGFLEGISSPWSPAKKERVSPASPDSRITFEPPALRSEPLEFAPISIWSPEDDPDPVPRLVRAAELGPDPNPAEPPPPPDPGPATMPIVPIADELPLAAVREAPSVPYGDAAATLELGPETFFRTEVIEEGAALAASLMEPQPIEAARKPAKAADPTASRSDESRAISTPSKPSFWKFGK